MVRMKCDTGLFELCHITSSFPFLKPMKRPKSYLWVCTVHCHKNKTPAVLSTPTYAYRLFTMNQRLKTPQRNQLEIVHCRLPQ